MLVCALFYHVLKKKMCYGLFYSGIPCAIKVFSNMDELLLISGGLNMSHIFYVLYGDKLLWDENELYDFYLNRENTFNYCPNFQVTINIRLASHHVRVPFGASIASICLDT